MRAPQPPALALAPKPLKGGVDDKRHDAQLPWRALDEGDVAIPPEDHGHRVHLERVVSHQNDARVLCTHRSPSVLCVLYWAAGGAAVGNAPGMALNSRCSKMRLSASWSSMPRVCEQHTRTHRCPTSLNAGVQAGSTPAGKHDTHIVFLVPRVPQVVRPALEDGNRCWPVFHSKKSGVPGATAAQCKAEPRLAWRLACAVPGLVRNPWHDSGLACGARECAHSAASPHSQSTALQSAAAEHN